MKLVRHTEFDVSREIRRISKFNNEFITRVGLEKFALLLVTMNRKVSMESNKNDIQVRIETVQSLLIDYFHHCCDVLDSSFTTMIRTTPIFIRDPSIDSCNTLFIVQQSIEKSQSNTNVVRGFITPLKSFSTKSS